MKILITKTGGVQMLHDDVADLCSLGSVTCKRASHVEFDTVKQKWYVQSAKTLEVLGYFESREKALAWEKDYYSPGGQGWSEFE